MPTCGGKRIRWVMHFALPFPFPSRKCVEERIEIDSRSFEFSIHNHLDRVYITRSSGVPLVVLVDKSRKTEAPSSKHSVTQTREHLQSVAVYREMEEYDSPQHAFADADKKVIACCRHLSDYLSRVHRSLPYRVAWLVYPVSLFDVGTVHHGLEHLCAKSRNWTIFACGVTINLARLMYKPLFYFDLALEHLPPELDTSNELLAEALISLNRGLNRLTTLNSYAAVESLANSVFKKKRKEQLIAQGKTPEEAEKIAERDRKRNRTKPKFLLHSGLQAMDGRSLLQENKKRYDQLLELYNLRNMVAHAGTVPTDQEARSGHTLCCEVVRWLAEVGGMPIRPMMPEKSGVSGFAVQSRDHFATPAALINFLRKLMDSIKT